MNAKNTLRLITIVDAKILMIQILLSQCLFSECPKRVSISGSLFYWLLWVFFYKIC